MIRHNDKSGGSLRREPLQIITPVLDTDFGTLQLALTHLDHSVQKDRLAVGHTKALSCRRPPSRSSRGSSRGSLASSFDSLHALEEDAPAFTVINIDTKLQDGRGSSCFWEKEPLTSSKKLCSKTEEYSEGINLYDDSLEGQSNATNAEQYPIVNSYSLSKDFTNPSRRVEDKSKNSKSLKRKLEIYSNKDEKSCSDTEVIISDRENVAEGGHINRKTVIKILEKRSLPDIHTSSSNPQLSRKHSFKSRSNESETRTIPINIEGGINVSFKNSLGPSIRSEGTSCMYVRQCDSENRPSRASAFNVRETIEKRQIQQERRDRKALRDKIRQQLRFASEGRNRRGRVNSALSANGSSASLRSRSMSSLEGEQEDQRSESPLFKVQSSPTLDTEKKGVLTYLFGNNLIDSPCLSERIGSSIDIPSYGVDYAERGSRSLGYIPTSSAVEETSKSITFTGVPEYKRKVPTPPPRHKKFSSSTGQLNNRDLTGDKPFSIRHSKERRSLRSSKHCNVDQLSDITSSTINSEPEWVTKARRKLESADIQLTTSTEKNSISSFGSVISDCSSTWSRRGFDALDELKEEGERIADELAEEALAKVEEELGQPKRSRMLEHTVVMEEEPRKTNMIEPPRVKEEDPMRSSMLEIIRNRQEESKRNKIDASKMQEKSTSITSNTEQFQHLRDEPMKTSKHELSRNCQDNQAEKVRVSFSPTHINDIDQTKAKIGKIRCKTKDEIRFGDLKHDWGGVQTNISRSTGHKEMRFGDVHYQESKNLDKSVERSHKAHGSSERYQIPFARQEQYKLPEMRFGDTPLNLFGVEPPGKVLSSKFESIAGPDPAKMSAEELNQNVEEYDFPIPNGTNSETILKHLLLEAKKNVDTIPEIISIEDLTKPRPKSILKRRSAEVQSEETENDSNFNVENTKNEKVDSQENIFLKSNDDIIHKIQLDQSMKSNETQQIVDVAHKDTGHGTNATKPIFQAKKEEKEYLDPQMSAPGSFFNVKLKPVQKNRVVYTENLANSHDLTILSNEEEFEVNSYSEDEEDEMKMPHNSSMKEKKRMSITKEKDAASGFFSKTHTVNSSYPSDSKHTQEGKNTFKIFDDKTEKSFPCRKKHEPNNHEQESSAKSWGTCRNGTDLSKIEAGVDLPKDSCEENEHILGLVKKNLSPANTQSDNVLLNQNVNSASSDQCTAPENVTKHCKNYQELLKARQVCLFAEEPKASTEHHTVKDKNRFNENPSSVSEAKRDIKEIICRSQRKDIEIYDLSRQQDTKSSPVVAPKRVKKGGLMKLNFRAPDLIDQQIKPFDNENTKDFSSFVESLNSSGHSRTSVTQNKRIHNQYPKMEPSFRTAEGNDKMEQEATKRSTKKKDFLIDWEAVQRRRLEEEERNRINKAHFGKPVSLKIMELVKFHGGGILSKFTKEKKTDIKGTVDGKDDIVFKKMSPNEVPVNVPKLETTWILPESSMKSPFMVKRVLAPLKPKDKVEDLSETYFGILDRSTSDTAIHPKLISEKKLKKSHFFNSFPENEGERHINNLLSDNKTLSPDIWKRKKTAHFSRDSERKSLKTSWKYISPDEKSKIYQIYNIPKQNYLPENDLKASDVVLNKDNKNETRKKVPNKDSQLNSKSSNASSISRKINIRKPLFTHSNVNLETQRRNRQINTIENENHKNIKKWLHSSPLSHVLSDDLSEGTFEDKKVPDICCTYPDISSKKRSFKQCTKLSSSQQEKRGPVSLSTILNDQRYPNSPPRVSPEVVLRKEGSPSHLESIQEKPTQRSHELENDGCNKENIAPSSKYNTYAFRSSRRKSSDSSTSTERKFNFECTSHADSDIGPFRDRSLSPLVSEPFSRYGRHSLRSRESSTRSTPDRDSSRPVSLSSILESRSSSTEDISNSRWKYKHLFSDISLDPSSKYRRSMTHILSSSELSNKELEVFREPISEEPPHLADSDSDEVFIESSPDRERLDEASRADIVKSISNAEASRCGTPAKPRGSSDSRELRRTSNGYQGRACCRGLQRNSSEKSKPEFILYTRYANERKSSVGRSTDDGRRQTVTTKKSNGSCRNSSLTRRTRRRSGSVEKARRTSRNDSERSTGVGRRFRADASRALEAWAAEAATPGRLLKKEGHKYRHEITEEIKGGERTCKAVERRVIRKGSQRIPEGAKILTETKESTLSGPPAGKTESERQNPTTRSSDGTDEGVNRRLRTQTEGERYVTQAIHDKKGLPTITTKGVDNRTIKSFEVIGGDDWEANRHIHDTRGESLTVELSDPTKSRTSAIVKKSSSKSTVIITKTKKKKVPVVV